MRHSTLLHAALALAGLALAAPASAAVSSSAITTPADPTFRTYDADLGPDAEPNRLTVSGVAASSAPAADRLDLRCFWTDSGGTLRANPLALRVPLAPNGSFSVTVDPATLSDNPFGAGTRDDAPGVQTCRLRATPAVGAITELNTATLAEYAGPRINIARFGSTTLGVLGGGNVTVDYAVGAGGLRGQAEWSSRCGAYSFRPYVNAAALSPALLPNWDCVRAVLPPDAGDGASQVRVDGIAAYTGASAPAFDFDADGDVERPTGSGGLAVEYRRGVTTGTVTTVEGSRLQRCATPAFPPTAASCRTLVDTGVVHERTTVLGDDGLEATITDTLRSADGAPHSVALDPEQYVVYDNDPVFRFPGEDAFAPHGPGDQPALGPAGVPGSVFTRDAITPDTPRQGSGAETWDRAPADVRFVATDFEYLERLVLDVPPQGVAASTRIFRVARSLGEAEAGARGAQARLAPPPPAPAPPLAPAPAPAPPARCIVPKLGRGSLYGTGRAKIKRAGCAAAGYRRVRSAVKRGRVVRTRPYGGTAVAPGTRVTLELSDGKVKARRVGKAAPRKPRTARSRMFRPTGAAARPPRPAANARAWSPRS